MIYNLFKGTLLRFLRAPADPPAAPAGSPGSVQVFRAAPNFLRYRLLLMMLGTVFVGLGEVAFLLVSVVSRETTASIAAIILVGITLTGVGLSYFLIHLEYEMRYYIVTDRSLRIRQGVLLIHEATYTFANIQNLKIHQGPIERLLSISNLVVQTAGGASPVAKGEEAAMSFHRGVLRGIADAQEIRDRILALLKRYRDAGLGDLDDRRPNAVVSATVIDRLREIRDELRGLRQATGNRSDV
ncbi:MAG: PH domain-containing protein [Planctomycetes bacterium]|nr:PH domain-containing protein [Planctomycetota bacterium]